jgi:hypothetical protein
MAMSERAQKAKRTTTDPGVSVRITKETWDWLRNRQYLHRLQKKPEPLQKEVLQAWAAVAERPRNAKELAAEIDKLMETEAAKAS